MHYQGAEPSKPDDPPAESGKHRRRRLRRTKNKTASAAAEGAFQTQSESLEIEACSTKADDQSIQKVIFLPFFSFF